MPNNPTVQALSAINPLIEHSEWSVDTASNVRHAIEFMADAIPAVVRDAGFNRNTAHGAHVLLRAIAAAVEVCHEQ